ncbi:MAG: hypothetical protein ACM3XM_19675 [Mycobacterium leprae]
MCSSCGRPACAECLVEINGQLFCKACLGTKVKSSKRDENGFVRFLLSVVPGLGHLYLGLFNRGLQFMVVAVVGGSILGLLRVDPLQGLFIAAMVFFSIFDAREAQLRIDQGLEVEDKGFVDLKTMRLEWNARYIGYILVAIGVLALYRTFMDDFLTMIYGAMAYRVQGMINGVVIGLLAIGAGVWLLRRNFKG